MTFRIPSAERRLSQPNNSDVNGNLYKTRNIDLDEEGYIKLAPAMVSVYSEADDVDFDNVNSIFHGSSLYFVGSDLFRVIPIGVKLSMINASATDTTPPTPGPEEDGVFFNSTEVVTDVDTLKYLSGSTWTTISGTPTASTAFPSVLEVFPNQNSVLFARGNSVARINSSWTVATTLVLPTDYVVTAMAVNGNYAYIATRHRENGEGVMFLWTGVNTTNDGSYGIGTFELSTIKKYGSTVAAIDSLGRLLQFNGSGFTELGALPVYYTRASWADASNNNDTVGNRGMVVDGDLIYITIKNEVEEVDKVILHNMVGAGWCYDPKVGLYQKYSSTNNTIVRDLDVDTADINTTTDVITVAGITVPATGSPVFYDCSTAIGGLIREMWYYTIKVTDTTFKLATTYQNAITGTAIDLTSASDNNLFFFVNQRDYGLGDNDSGSAILLLNSDEYESQQVGRVVMTANADPASGLTQQFKAMMTCPKIRNFGYFVTPKMFSEDNQDVFKSLVLRFRPLKYADKITVKYKTSEKATFPAVPRSSNDADNLVTWSSSTSFTTVAAPSRNTYDFSEVAMGDEIEVLNGSGSNFHAHVASISKSGFQYTVTIDTANPFITASDTSEVIIDNWKTLEVIDGTTFFGQEKIIDVGANSAWIQFKICMEGTDITIYDSVVNNRPYARA